MNRVLRDDPSKGDMNNREGIGLKLLWKATRDWEQWPLYINGLLPVSGLAGTGFRKRHLSLTLEIPHRHTSESANKLSILHPAPAGILRLQANLLVIPSQFLFPSNLLFITWVSRRAKERAVVSSTSSIWFLPCFVALVTLPASASPWTRHAILTVFLSYPYCHAILVAWNAENSNAVRTRAVSAALYNMFVQSGNIFGQIRTSLAFQSLLKIDRAILKLVLINCLVEQIFTERRLALIPKGQQDIAWDNVLEHCPLLPCKGLPPVAEPRQGPEVESHDSSGTGGLPE